MLLEASDRYGGKVSNEILLRIYPEKPFIDTANATCKDGLTYSFLDDEPYGMYLFSFNPCFKP
jgi:hypothetical protein